jgi:UDP-perosamine 4-acetyltransferase
LRLVVVIGSGGHAKVVIDILREQPDCELIGCLSPEPVGTVANGVRVIGGDDLLPDLLRDGASHAFVALGDNRLRAKMLHCVSSLGFHLLNAISRHAVLSPSVTVRAGVAVMPGAIVNADTVISDGVIVNTGATVDHDCRLGAHCHIAPGTNLAGNVHIGSGAFLGTGVRVIPRVRIGEWSTVGAGAVVISDLPDNVVAIGVPARITKQRF